jgi:TolB-like protein
MKRHFCIILMLLLICSHLYSAEKKKPEQITIAVMNFQANNCPDSISRVVTEMLAGNIFEINYLTLLERSMMDTLIKEKGINKKNLTDAKSIAKAGKILSVQKIVVGSVNKLDRYIVEARLIDVASGSIEKRISLRADEEGDLDITINRVSESINNHFLGIKDITGEFNISVSGSLLMATGSFATGAGYGYGTNLFIQFNEILETDFVLSFNGGYYIFNPELKSINEITLYPLELSSGYPFRVNRHIELTPALGGGLLISRISFDRIETRTWGEYKFNTEYYFNLMTVIRVDMNIRLAYRWLLTFSPSYTLFFESSSTGSFISAALGLKLLF